MTITIAGHDRPDLADQVRRRADELARGARIPDIVSKEIGAPALAQSDSDAGYQENFIRLLRYRDAVDTLDFEIPRRPGAWGLCIRKLKQVLWKLLRYQHDRITFRQNMINGLFTRALEDELILRRRETAELRARLAALESRTAPGTRQPLLH